MNAIAVVDAGYASQAFYKEYFERIRRESGADAILVITDGDVSREGMLSAADKYERTARFVTAGAAAVVEMPLCGMLLAENVYAFAVTCMLQKLDCVNMVAISYAGGSAELFEKITSFLFDEPRDYQRQMRLLRSGGVELRRALPGVLEKFIPGAEEFLKQPANHMAVELYNTLRRAYFPAKPHMVQIGCHPEAAAPSAAQDQHLLNALRGKLLSMPPQQAAQWATGMYFGNAHIVQRVLDALNSGAAESYEQLSELAMLPGAHAVSIRWHLMACLTGYRKVDSFVCITYNYIPYIRALGVTDEFLPVLEQTAGTTLLLDTAQKKDFSRMNDPAKALLNRIDGCARELFLAAK